MRKFEIVERFKGSDLALPKRETKNAVGYDVAVAEDTVIMPFAYQMGMLIDHINEDRLTDEITDKLESLVLEEKFEEAKQLDLESMTCT